MNAPQKTIMNANLFSRLFDGLDDPNRLAIETIDGHHISYGDLISRAGRMANVLVSRGVKPGTESCNGTLIADSRRLVAAGPTTWWRSPADRCR